MSISQPSSYSLPLPPPEPIGSGPVGSMPAETDDCEIVGSSAAIRRLRLQVRRIGPHFRTVLVKGEPGTEKELVARALHAMTQTPGAPFVACNAAEFEAFLAGCNGVVEADLAGSWMTVCDGGTLFLGEISKMPLKAQRQLLDAIKKHELARCRVDASQRPDLRVIASTSEDLRIMVSTGRFLQELYHRLTTVEITVPPLRERIDDLDELVRHFLGRLAQLYGRSFHDIPEVAMEQLRRHRWPNNVRELERMLRDGVMQSKGESIELYPLSASVEPNGLEQSAATTSKSMRLQDVVAEHVLRVLKDSGGNKLRAAEALGISRSTLYRILDTAK
jgi:DNA-binding NtrC family response regulator